MSLERVILQKFDELNARIDSLQADVQGLYATLASFVRPDAILSGDPTLSSDTATLDTATVAAANDSSSPTSDYVTAPVYEAEAHAPMDDAAASEVDFGEMMEELDHELASCDDGIAQQRPMLPEPGWAEVGMHGTEWLSFFDFSPASRVIRTATGT